MTHSSRFTVLFCALAATVAAASVIDYDMSPVCVAQLPVCQSKCPAPKDFIFVCSAGGGVNGGPSATCTCVVPDTTNNSPNTVAQLQLIDWPGAKACNLKTWINDCGTQLTASVSGAATNFTPAITSAFGSPCATQSGIVTGANQAIVAWPQYPLGVLTSPGDGRVYISFSQGTGADASNYASCYATYNITQGTYLNNSAASGTAGLGVGSSTPGSSIYSSSSSSGGSSTSAGDAFRPGLLALIVSTLIVAILSRPYGSS